MPIILPLRGTVPGRTDQYQVSPAAPFAYRRYPAAPELEADLLRRTNMTKTQCAVQPDRGCIAESPITAII